MGIGEVIFILLIAFLVGMTLYVRHREKKAFNNGICNHCGSNLKSFAMDSNGGTGWNCENSKCENYLWTSWVKEKKRK